MNWRKMLSPSSVIPSEGVRGKWRLLDIPWCRADSIPANKPQPTERKNKQMMTGYSTMTAEEVRRELKALRKAGKAIASSPEKARKFLIRAGILAKNGKGLAAKYR